VHYILTDEINSSIRIRIVNFKCCQNLFTNNKATSSEPVKKWALLRCVIFLLQQTI